MRQGRRAFQRVAPARPHHPRQRVKNSGFYRDKPEGAANNQKPLLRNYSQIEAHADRDKKQTEQQTAERFDIGFDLMLERRLRQKRPGEKCAERHGKPRPGDRERHQRHDEQRRCSKRLTRAGPGDKTEDTIKAEFPDENHNRDYARSLDRRIDAVFAAARARNKRHCGKKRNNRQILKQQHRKRLCSISAVQLAAVFHPLQRKSG